MPFIEKNKLSYIALIHKLSEIIKDKNYINVANNIANFSKEIIFPAKYVQEEFKR